MYRSKLGFVNTAGAPDAVGERLEELRHKFNCGGVHAPKHAEVLGADTLPTLSSKSSTPRSFS